MKIAIINVNLEYKFDDSMSDKEIEEEMCNIELPKEYVEDSFEFVKIVKENK
jgi:hypothetical protein